MTRATAKRPGSALRQALAAKTSLRTHFDIAQADTATVLDAQRKLDATYQLQVATLLHEDPKVQERAEQAVQEARAARDALFHRIWCRGLTLDEFDALVGLNPPTPEQAREGRVWGDGFDLALLAECVEDSDLTAAEWAAELAGWSAPDRRKLLGAALDAQRQTLADAVPKD